MGMKYLPRNMKAPKTRMIARQKKCKPRLAITNPEKCFDYRKEFDLIVGEKYTEMSPERREILWRLTGSYLIQSPGSMKNPKDRLTIALQQAQEKIP